MRRKVQTWAIPDHGSVLLSIKLESLELDKKYIWRIRDLMDAVLGGFMLAFFAYIAFYDFSHVGLDQ